MSNFFFFKLKKSYALQFARLASITPVHPKECIHNKHKQKLNETLLTYKTALNFVKLNKIILYPISLNSKRLMYLQQLLHQTLHDNDMRLGSRITAVYDD